jgi:D-alanyl-D-alanine dipeptidase
MKKYTILSVLLVISLFSFAQNDDTKNPYHLPIVNNFASYQAALKQNPDLELVEIKKAIPTVVLDIRYATTNNFMKRVMYKQARAFARKPVVEKLKLVHAELAKTGLGLKVFDAYRPYAVTLDFYAEASDKNFVANPKSGSKHNRGCAVDISVINLKTGKEIAMPTPYDSFEAAAAPSYTNLPAKVIQNRDSLIEIMHKHGFQVIPNEWWHFDFRGWENYSLMDIPFEQL